MNQLIRHVTPLHPVDVVWPTVYHFLTLCNIDPAMGGGQANPIRNIELSRSWFSTVCCCCASKRVESHSRRAHPYSLFSNLPDVVNYPILPTMTLYKVCLIIGFASLLHVAYSAVQREYKECEMGLESGYFWHFLFPSRSHLSQDNRAGVQDPATGCEWASVFSCDLH